MPERKWRSPAAARPTRCACNNCKPAITCNAWIRRSEAEHEELVKAGVADHMPAPGLASLKRGWRAPPPQFAATWQHQVPELPTDEQHGLAQPDNIRVATLSREQNLTRDTVARSRRTYVGALS